MITLLAGLVAVAIVYWLSGQFARANPAVLAKALRTVGGGAALAAAAALMLRGRIDMAVLLGGAGSWLLGWKAFGFAGRRAAPKPGNVSRVRSAMIEMELDHDTGAMDGSVLAGPLMGRRLGELDEAALMRLYQGCSAADPEGVRLLEAYFDRRFPTWREDAERDRDTGAGTGTQTAAMSEKEAYQILGLQPGASLDEIRKAHRTLMKKLHPDQGGSTYLAARVNRAKEILLNRHR
jgi:DnaJ domain